MLFFFELKKLIFIYLEDDYKEGLTILGILIAIVGTIAGFTGLAIGNARQLTKDAVVSTLRRYKDEALRKLGNVLPALDFCTI